MDITGFSQLSALMKLRVVVGLIFLLSTVAMVLAVVSDFFFAVLLILLSYLMVFILMIKLFLIKRL